jgi:hypothetical protein
LRRSQRRLYVVLIRVRVGGNILGVVGGLLFRESLPGYGLPAMAIVSDVTWQAVRVVIVVLVFLAWGCLLMLCGV